MKVLYLYSSETLTAPHGSQLTSLLPTSIRRRHQSPHLGLMRADAHVGNLPLDSPNGFAPPTCVWIFLPEVEYVVSLVLVCFTLVYERITHLKVHTLCIRACIQQCDHERIVRQPALPQRQIAPSRDRVFPYPACRRSCSILVHSYDGIVRDDLQRLLRHIRNIISQDQRTLQQRPHRKVGHCSTHPFSPINPLRITRGTPYSSKSMPPFPTSSISRSFQWPGPPFCPTGAAKSIIRETAQWKPGSLQSSTDVHGHRSSNLSKWSTISPEIRQLFAIVTAKFHGPSSPQLHIEKSIGRPVVLRA